ncbi:MAG: hypothetical protein H8E43_03020 [Planctomycetia bacterium]|nr:hypothetical protein [Planctomycetia bacterium]MBL6915596.1 hypothetical protein [Planctomycetota bacterium]
MLTCSDLPPISEHEDGEEIGVQMMMRSNPLWLCWLLILMPVSLISTSMLEGQSPEELESRWKKKQESAFLKAVKWERTLDAAIERARRDNLPIVAYFTRSYSP